MDKKTIRKNEIIGASIGLMHRNGYNGTSVKDITEAAGIPKGSFYNYFEGKEEYAVEAISYYLIAMHDDVAIFSDERFEPLDRIKKFYRVKIDKLSIDGREKGCFVGNLTEEIGSIYPSISEATEKFHQKIAEYICTNLMEARKNGTLTNIIDESVLADFIVGSWQGVLLRSKVSNNDNHLNNFYEMLNIDLLR